MARGSSRYRLCTGAGNTMECVLELKFIVPTSLVPRLLLVWNMNIARQGEPSIFSQNFRTTFYTCTAQPTISSTLDVQNIPPLPANEIHVINCPVPQLLSLFSAPGYPHMQLRSLYPLCSREITYVRKRYQALSTFTIAMFESLGMRLSTSVCILVHFQYIGCVLNKLVLSKKRTSNSPGCLYSSCCTATGNIAQDAFQLIFTVCMRRHSIVSGLNNDTVNATYSGTHLSWKKPDHLSLTSRKMRVRDGLAQQTIPEPKSDLSVTSRGDSSLSAVWDISTLDTEVSSFLDQIHCNPYFPLDQNVAVSSSVEHREGCWKLHQQSSWAKWE